MMRQLLTMAFALCSSVALVAQGFQPHGLFRVQQVADVALSPDGDYVAYTINKERPLSEGAGSDYRELYVLDRVEGTTTPYITGKMQLYDIQWKPDGETITFRARMDGDRGMQLYAINLEGGSYYKLADLPYSVREYEWRPDGEEIAFSAEEKPAATNAALRDLGFKAEVYEEDIAHINLYTYELDDQEVEQVTEGVTVHSFDWHPSGEKLAAQIAPQNLVDDYYMFKRINIIYPEDKRVEQLVNNPGKLTSMAWSEDGEYLAFVSAADISDPVSGSLYIVEEDNEKDFTELTNYTAGFEGSVMDVAWADDETVIFSSEESVHTTLRSFEVDDEEVEDSELLLSAGTVILNDFAVAENVVAFAGNTPQHPNELFTFNLKKKRLNRHTTLNPWLAKIKFGRQEKVSYEARDGLRIDGVLIYPVNYQEGQRYPLITYVHGGPEAAVHHGWTTYYSMWGQAAAARGYVVFMPNYRASSGRGVEFSKMDHKDLGAAEFDDVIDGINYLTERGLVDEDQIGIGGGSYGGYFAAWAATKHSELFDASVVFVGISNQISKRNLTDIPYEDYYVHWRIWTNEDPELVYDRSPVKWVEGSTTPTLILHGKEDTRVHPSQSLELYRQLKLHGEAPVRLIWYPGEGHGNRLNPNRLDYILRTMRWFDYYLKDEGPQDQLPPKDIDYQLDFQATK